MNEDRRQAAEDAAHAHHERIETDATKLTLPIKAVWAIVGSLILVIGSLGLWGANQWRLNYERGLKEDLVTTVGKAIDTRFASMESSLNAIAESLKETTAPVAANTKRIAELEHIAVTDEMLRLWGIDMQRELRSNNIPVTTPEVSEIRRRARMN